MIPIFEKKLGRMRRTEHLPFLSGRFDMAEETEFWFETLLNKVMSVIIVESSDSNFNIVDFKSQLILNGMTFVTRKKGRVLAFRCTPAKLFGLSYTTFTKVNISSPQFAEVVDISNGVLVRNTELYSSLYRLISHYAVLLAHADITLQKSFVNVRRETGGLIATSEREKKDIATYLDVTFNGGETPILTAPFRDAVSLSEKPPTSPREIIETRDNIINDFLTEIGVKTSKNKRGNMQTAEVEADAPKILISISDIIRNWRIGAEEIENKYGIKLNIYQNPDTDINTYANSSQLERGESE